MYHWLHHIYWPHYNACAPIYCKTGYQLFEEGNYCIDIDECDNSTDDCEDNEFCRNNEGSFTCERCPFGIELGENNACVNTDECTNSEAQCRYGTCVNDDGSYS